MKNLCLFLVIFLLFSCKTKTVENSGGIQITLRIQDSKPSAKKYIDETIEVLQKRMEFFCGDNPTVTLDSLNNEIVINLPNQHENKLPIFLELIAIKGKLRILETYNLVDFFPYLEGINNLIVNEDESDYTNEEGLVISKEADQYPLFKLLTPSEFEDMYFQPVLGYCKASDTAKLNALFNTSEALAQTPHDAKFYWSRYATDGKISLYALKIPVSESYIPITSDMIENAEFSHNEMDGNTSVTFRLFEKHHQYWNILTRKNIDKSLTILIDDLVYSSPVVREEMTDGTAQISGHLNKFDGSVLTAILNSGELKNNVSVKKMDVIPLK